MLYSPSCAPENKASLKSKQLAELDWLTRNLGFAVSFSFLPFLLTRLCLFIVWELMSTFECCREWTVYMVTPQRGRTHSRHFSLRNTMLECP